MAYLRSKLIDFKLGKDIFKIFIPAAVLGTLASSHVPSDFLKALFGVGILYIGLQIYRSYVKEVNEHRSGQKHAEKDRYETTLVDSGNQVFRYTYCNKPRARLFGFIGGAFVGLISVGLGELLDYHLVSKCKVPTPVAVGTAIFCCG